MEWSKAKRLTIILLVAINIVLLVLNINKEQSYRVSRERIENIVNVCKNNNINIECSLPESIEARSQLGIQEYNYDYVTLQQIFFGSISGVQRTSDYTSVIFTRDNERLVVENSRAVFTGGTGDYNEYILKLNELLGEFNVVKNIGDSIYYYQSFNELPVFSNYICVEESNGAVNITLNYSRIRHSVGARESIIGADEAVYSAVDDIVMDIEGERSITSIEIGYYDSRTNLSQEGTIPPVYAICVNDRMYFVNAYTGICYK